MVMRSSTGTGPSTRTFSPNRALMNDDLPELNSPAITSKNSSSMLASVSAFCLTTSTGEEIERTIEDFARTAALALEAGYDGVEIMGSEGYLINEFVAAETNHRTDEFGGSVENRLMPLKAGVTPSTLTEASNFLNARYS